MYALQIQYIENSKQIFQEMKLRGLSPNSYIHVSVSVFLYMYSHYRPAYSAALKHVDRLLEYINPTQIHVCANWD